MSIAIPKTNTVNKRYTEKETDELKKAYLVNPSIETVDLLIERFNRSKKSIISKLAREGVYKSKNYTPKYGVKPATKIQIVTNIAEGLELPTSKLVGLAKAEKACLIELEKELVNRKIINEASI